MANDGGNSFTFPSPPHEEGIKADTLFTVFREELGQDYGLQT
jgi:hypothetical protein